MESVTMDTSCNSHNESSTILKEHELMTQLISILPKKFQKGIFSSELLWTSIDASEEYIAVGCSEGIVFLVDRKRLTLERLTCQELKGQEVSSVKMQNSVDYVVAVGTVTGLVCIFQMPCLLPGRNKKLQVYIVSKAHHASISALEWSQNAMRLFSGDEDGLVMCSEIDYITEKSSSFHIAKEPHLVVQLSYAHKILVISTRFRSVLCFTDEQNKILQIGKKDRKNLDRYGACFLPGVYQAKDAVIYAARPGLRFWKSNVQGTVETTIMLKDMLARSPKQIPLLGHRKKTDFKDPQLGTLHIFQDTMLFSHHGPSCYVIDPGLGNFACVHPNVGDIISVAVGKEEVFLLCRDGVKPIVRLGTMPDPVLGSPHADSSLADSKTTFSLTSSKLSSTIVGTLKGVGEKLQSVQDGHRELQPPPWGLIGQVAGEVSQSGLGDGDTPVVVEDKVSTASEAEAGTPSPERDITIVTDTAVSHSDNTLPEASSQPEAAPTDNTGDIIPVISEASRTTMAAARSEPEDSIVFSTTVTKPTKKGKKKKSKTGKVVDSDSGSVSSFDQEPEPRPPRQKSSPVHGILTSNGAANNCKSEFSSGKAIEANHTDVEGSEDSRPHVGDDQSPLPSRGTEAAPCVNKFGIDFNALLGNEAVHVSKDHEAKKEDEEDNIGEEFIVDKPASLIDNSPEPLAKTAKDTSEASSLFDNRMEAPVLQHRAQVAAVQQPIVISKAPTELVSNILPSSKPEGLSLTIDERINKTLEIDYACEEPVPQSPDNFVSIYEKGSWASSATSPESEPSIAELVDDIKSPSATKGKGESEKTHQAPRKQEKTPTGRDISSQLLRMSDSWTEFRAPSNIQGFCVSDKHIWVTDKNDKLFYSPLCGPGLRWKKVDLPAKQLAVSPSGWIVWRLHGNSVYIGTNITTRVPYGLKPVEVARAISFIAVDNTTAWYIKTNNEVMMQKGLSQERPSFRSIPVSCPQPMIQISCRNGVVWALTKDRDIFARTGVRKGLEEGTDWIQIQRLGSSVLASSINVGDNDSGWLLDVGGRVWFTTEVTTEQPQGNGKWWQVSLSKYLMSDASALESLRAVVNLPQNLARFAGAGSRGGLLSTTNNGVWICPSDKHTLHVCRGSLLGHRWEWIVPKGLPLSTQWANVSAQSATANSGHIWIQLATGGLFCLPVLPSTKHLQEINCPSETLGAFSVLSATAEAVWGLDTKGCVYIRSGVTAHCPQGIKWLQLDTTQLGSACIVGLSCGYQNVWAVDQAGGIYLRIGLVAPSQTHLNPAWVPVDGSTNAIGAKFCHVTVGPNDWMVWAIDSRKNVYVRKNITDAMPIGTHWVHVEGANATSLSISKDLVYALTTENEVIVRYGICPADVMGDYWRKIPGVFNTLSVTYDNKLWGINPERQLHERHVCFMKRRTALEDLGQDQDEEIQPADGWEII